MNINQTVALNLSEAIAPPTLRMAQDDANTRTIKASLWDGAQPFSIPTECVCMVRFGKPDGTGGLYDTTEGGQKVSYSGNVVTAPVAAQMLAVAGVVKAQIDIYGGGKEQQAEKLATFRFRVEVEPSAYADAKIISSDYYNVLSSQIAAAVEAGAKADAAIAAAETAQNAATAAVNAKTAAESAKTAAENAKTTAVNSANTANGAKTAAESAKADAVSAKNAAAGSATAAAGSASSAEEDAQSAAQDAEDAEAWAVGKRNGADVPSTDPTYHNNAKYYKDQAQGIAGGEYVSYGAEQALSDAQKAQARSNIGAAAPYEAGDNIAITGQVISTKAFPCNPNLLDNWYFGNPVNQRGGHIVPAGTPYFVPGSSTQSGVLSSPATVIGYLNSDGQLYPQVKVGSETYITPIGTDILGYVGVGYSIDRWRGSAEDTTVAVATGGISVSGKQFQRLEQRVEDAQSLNGIAVTFSALVKNPYGKFRLALYNATTGALITQDAQASEDFQLVQITATPAISAGDSFSAFLYPGANDATTVRTCLIKAVKLELGSQQTLAHQENGAWVLNEIPDYGEQLRRCQRYYVRYSAAGQAVLFTGIVRNNADVRAVLTRLNMRTAPVVGYGGNMRAYIPGGSPVVVKTVTRDLLTKNGGSLDITTNTSSEFTAGLGVIISAANNDTASESYIDLSADL